AAVVPPPARRLASARTPGTGRAPAGRAATAAEPATTAPAPAESARPSARAAERSSGAGVGAGCRRAQGRQRGLDDHLLAGAHARLHLGVALVELQRGGVGDDAAARRPDR